MRTVCKNIQPARSNFEKKKKTKKKMMLIIRMVMICVTQKSVVNHLFVFQVLVLGAFLKCL